MDAMNTCVHELRLLLLLKLLYSPKRYFLNPSLTKSLIYVLSFPPQVIRH